MSFTANISGAAPHKLHRDVSAIGNFSKMRRGESSLIGVIEVKLFLIGFLVVLVASVGHSLLFAVGARPPHDGVRRARRLNLFRDLAGSRLQALDS